MTTDATAAGTARDTEPVYRRTLTVQAPIDRAFAVFTDGFDRWWPRSHHIGQADMAEAVIEPQAGGRWFEKGVDGSECEWGRVLAWDPPRHVALSWHLNAEFEYEPDPERASRVDARFSDLGDGTTRLEFTHSQLDRLGAEWRAMKERFASDGGWSTLLEGYAAAVGDAR